MAGEGDVELLLDRVTPAEVAPPSWSGLVDRARRRRRRRHAAVGAAGAVVILAVLGVVAVASDPSDEVRVIDDGTPDTTAGFSSVTEELGVDLRTGLLHVYPPELGEDQADPYADPEAVVADFARDVLRWPDPVEVDVPGAERAEVRHPATGRSLSLDLGRDDDGGWVVERAGDRLVIDPETGAPVVERPDGTVAVVVAETAIGGSGGDSTGLGTTAGAPLTMERRGPLDDSAIVVAASFDADGRVIQIATARDEDLEPPPLRYPQLVLDSLQLRGAAGVVDESDPSGLMIAIGEFDGDSEFRHAGSLFVSDVPPWPSRITGQVEPDPVEIGGREADVIVEDLSGRRWVQVYLDDLTVLVEDGPFSERIVEAIVSPDELSDPEQLRFDTIGGSLREVDRTPYGTHPVVFLASEPADDGRSLLIYADRGPQFGTGGRFERIDRGVAPGGGWQGELAGVDGRPGPLLLTWEATWGTWLTVIASGFDRDGVVAVADAIELVGRDTWEATYGP